VVVTNEVTTLLANLSVTSEQKAAPIVPTGEMTTMTTINPKVITKKDESLMQSMMMEDGTEIEKESELLEFDDFSEVDYDLDYTVQY